MSEKMINDMIERMEELKAGKHGNVEELTFHKIMMHVFDIAKKYAVDMKDIIAIASMRSDLSVEELKNLANLNK